MQLDMKPVDFITVGTIGPRGKRVFHLQAGHEDRLVSFVLEKEQTRALSEAIREFVDDLDERLEETTEVEMAALDMELREPIEPLFRISQMGLGYEEDNGWIILIAQELVIEDEDEDEIGTLSSEESDSGVVRMWCTRSQMLALSLHAISTVEAGRPDPKQNGRIAYYWT